MSIPPVDAPVRITIPRLTPIMIPPKTVQSTISSVSAKREASISEICNSIGKQKLESNVLAANLLPIIRQPTKNRIVFITNATCAVLKPHKWWKNKAIPVPPPVIRPEGSIKNATARA